MISGEEDISVMLSEYILGKCRYCGAQVGYQDGSTYIKCDSCGENLVVAEFQNEQIKIRRALEAGEQAKRALEQAEKDRKAEQEKTWKVISDMNSLKGSLKEQEAQLHQILKETQLDQETQKTVLSLLQIMKNDQQQAQGSVFSVLNQIVDGQDTAQQKLNALQAVTAQLTDNNADILNAVNQISVWLDTDVQQRNQISRDLFAWFNSHTLHDQEQLKQINTISTSLLAGQDRIEDRISDLRKTVEDNQNAIQSFEGKWERSKLNELAELYHQAENLQLDMEFDRAEEYYRKVIVSGGKDPEVYWRIILCHYGIVYQKDNEGNKIPSILRPDLTTQISIRNDLENSYRGDEDRKYYSSELQRIDHLLDKYRQCQQTAHYDVFISVKQKIRIDEREAYTEDYKIGNDLFTHLTKRGLRVFNSEQQECKRPGEEWEPYILAALLSSKMMIVVGTTTEFMNSQWVRNEWQRFQWLQKEEKKTGKTARKLVCFIDNMTGYDLPRGLEPIQAILNKAGAYQELDSVVKAAFPEKFRPDESRISPSGPALQEKNKTSIDAIRNKMKIWLGFRQFDLVQEEYKKIIRDTEYALDIWVNLYSICARHQYTNITRLESSEINLDNEEIIPFILENSKDPEAVQVLRDLLDKNKQNRRAATGNPPKNNTVPPNRTAGKTAEAKKTVLPLIRSVELYDKEGRLDRYLENLKIKQDWVKMPEYPPENVFISDFTYTLSAKIEYNAPLKDTSERITWSLLTAGGKPISSEKTEVRTIAPDECKQSSINIGKAFSGTVRPGKYMLCLKVNGSDIISRKFQIITLESLKIPNQEPKKPEIKPAPPAPAPPVRKEHTKQEKISFWKENLPSVYRTVLFGALLDRKTVNNAIKRLNVVVDYDDVLGLIEAKKGSFKGIVTVMVTTQRIIIDVNEKTYTTLAVHFNSIKSVTATPMNTAPKKSSFNVILKSGNQRVIAETQKAMTDTINFRALANAVNAYLRRFES